MIDTTAIACSCLRTTTGIGCQAGASTSRSAPAAAFTSSAISRCTEPTQPKRKLHHVVLIDRTPLRTHVKEDGSHKKGFSSATRLVGFTKLGPARARWRVGLSLPRKRRARRVPRDYKVIRRDRPGGGTSVHLPAARCLHRRHASHLYGAPSGAGKRHATPRRLQDRRRRRTRHKRDSHPRHR